jgi:hypothetical protein
MTRVPSLNGHRGQGKVVPFKSKLLAYQKVFLKAKIAECSLVALNNNYIVDVVNFVNSKPCKLCAGKSIECTKHHANKCFKEDVEAAFVNHRQTPEEKRLFQEKEAEEKLERGVEARRNKLISDTLIQTINEENSLARELIEEVFYEAEQWIEIVLYIFYSIIYNYFYFCLYHILYILD